MRRITATLLLTLSLAGSLLSGFAGAQKNSVSLDKQDKTEAPIPVGAQEQESGAKSVSPDSPQAQLSRLQQSSPRKKVAATFRADRLLKEYDLVGADYLARATTVWIGAEVQGQIRGGHQATEPGESITSALQRYRFHASNMEGILQRTKPDSNIEIPSSYDYGVYGFTVEGTAAEIESVRRAVSAAKLIDVSARGKNPIVLTEDAVAKAPHLNSSKAVTAQAASARRFLPNRGSFEAKQLQTGYRYILNWVYWDRESSLSGFGPNDAYEHQTVLDGSDGKTYMGRYNNSGWSFPGGYFDTQKLNNQGIAGSPNEPDWTVGEISAVGLKAGTWYYTWIVCQDGNASSDRAKLTGQVRERRPSWCYRPWCVNGSGETQWIKSAWEINLPTGFSWVKSSDAPPKINDISPRTITVGVDRALTVNGSDFRRNFSARIRVNGRTYRIYPGAQTNFISSSQVQVTVKVGSSNSPNTPFSLWIVNEDGQPSNEFTGLTAVRASTQSPPSVSSYSWNTTPRGSNPFSGRVTGTGFIARSTQVFFCVYRGTACYEHPSAGVSVNSTRSLSVSNVRLSKGTWQLYVRTSAGQSGRSTAFTVR